MPNKLKLYGMDISPMVRTCKLVLKLLDIDYDYEVVNLMTREHQSQEFGARNPVKLVPVLEDNGHFLYETAAICCYLIDKYGKDDKLYPKDLIQRAKVNQGLYFTLSELFVVARAIPRPILKQTTTVVTKERMDDLKNSFELLEAVLDGKDYMSANTLTLADIVAAPIVMIGWGFIKNDQERFPNIKKWLERISKEVPHFNETHVAATEGSLSTVHSMITEIQT